MQTLLSTHLSENMDPEDREIIEKLAKLQNMYAQIGGLRSLLPEKLINPARVALDNPGEFKPERLATYLQTAAKSGSQDVEKFKQDWHSDDVRELWHTVNANDLPQGGDAWPLEYGGLLQDTAAQEQPSTTANEAARDFQPPSGPELVQLVDEFRARHPEMKIDVLDGANPLPIDIQVAQLDLRVEERRSAIGIEYIIIGKPGTESFSLRNDVLQSISESKDRARLATLLEMIASYHDIKTKPCHKCHKLFDTKTLQLPLIRQTRAPQKDSDPRFVALHRSCR